MDSWERIVKQGRQAHPCAHSGPSVFPPVQGLAAGFRRHVFRGGYHGK